MEYKIVIGIVGLLYAAVLLPDLIKLYKIFKAPSIGKVQIRLVERLNWIILSIGILSTVIIVTFRVNIFSYQSPMPFSSISEITLEDFKGLKKPYQMHQGINSFAFISTNIVVKRINNGWNIVSYFHPARSYTYQHELETKELLIHELYHFKVTEIGARELRKQISNYDEIPEWPEVKKLLTESNLNLDSMQQKYDYETNHSLLLGKQLQWQKKIDSLLNSLDFYSSTTVQF